MLNRQHVTTNEPQAGFGKPGAKDAQALIRGWGWEFWLRAQSLVLDVGLNFCCATKRCAEFERAQALRPPTLLPPCLCLRHGLYPGCRVALCHVGRTA